jgi:hypothetical protein
MYQFIRKSTVSMYLLYRYINSLHGFTVSLHQLSMYPNSLHQKSLCIYIILDQHSPCTVYMHNTHRWASTSILMSTISDIRHRQLFFRHQRQICRTEKCHSDIGIRVHSDIRH